MSLLNGTVTAGPSVGPAAAAQLMPVMIGPVAGPVVNGGGGGGKDSRWLTLEVCREFARSKCSRSDEECKYAHPPPHVEIQNGRVMCCFDSIKGKCQRKEPPCKYLHPPQHLKEILLQNGRQNLINKNMQLQAALQPLLSMPSGMVPVDGCYDGRYAGPWTIRDPYKLATDNMDFMVYEPGPSGAIKHQTATIIPNAGAYSNGIVLPGPSSATSNGGQYLFSTMLQQPNAPQFILPAGATNAAAGYPCYGSTLAGFSPTAFYPTIDGSSSSVSLHPGSLITHNGAPNRAWTLAGLQAASGSYGLPVATSGATIHTMPYDVGAATQFQQVSTQTLPGNGALPSSSSAAGQLGVETPSATGLIPPTDGVNSPGLTSTSLDQSITSSSMSYCQPSIYYKGMTALPNGSMVPVFKRHALIDAKTGLPVYQQLPATAPSYQQQMTALNSFQPQQFVSVSIANPSQLQRF